MSEDWAHQGIGGGFFDPDRPETGGDPSSVPVPSIPVFYTPSSYRGFSNPSSGTFPLLLLPTQLRMTKYGLRDSHNCPSSSYLGTAPLFT